MGLEYAIEGLIIFSFLIISIIIIGMSIFQSFSSRPAFRLIHWLGWLFSFLLILISFFVDESFAISILSLYKEPSYFTIIMILVVVYFIWRSYLFATNSSKRT